jgi:FixJ family two-component response regulator
MADRQVWLIEPDDTLRRMLRDLFEREDFTVRECCTTAEVLRGLLHGESGIVVADATQLTYINSPDLHNFGRLSNAVAVLLLCEDADLVSVVPADFANCKVLYRPYEDVANLIRTAVELTESGPNFRYALAGVF